MSAQCIASRRRRPKVDQIFKKPESRDGTCCACGSNKATDGQECPKREDGSHCRHWWEGDGKNDDLAELSPEDLGAVAPPSIRHTAKRYRAHACPRSQP